ncbi:MAG: acyltransferase, partial [Ruminococcus sp.]|nr:acyltransferase [Ruminococcus sp.]
MTLKLSLQESNCLKGIALILLLIHHLFYIQHGQYDDIEIVGHGLVNTLGIVCKVCVALFVFLSGYGLGLSIQKAPKLDIKRFYIRRFTKLFLNYWFIWLLFVPIGVLLFDRHLDVVYGEDGWLYGILDFLGLLNITGKLGYNPTWWFYSCIILLYLIFPLIAHTVKRHPNLIWIYLLASIMIIKLPFSFINPIRYYLFPFILGIFFSNYLYLKQLPPARHDPQYVHNVARLGANKLEECRGVLARV